MPIYTKKGDKGETGLFRKKDGKSERVAKDNARVEAIGTIDELNSFIGVAVSLSENPYIESFLKDIQMDLFTVGSILAGSNLPFAASKTKKLEKLIDKLDLELIPLKNFILPNGSKLSSCLQYARALSRRAERRIVSLNKFEKLRAQILTYMNRLSDALFTLARYANARHGFTEETWEGRKVRSS